MAHADKCPKRSGGGVVFRQRKGKSKLTVQGLSTGPGSDASPACYDTSTAATLVFLIPA
jgi:hypothetical protein